MPLLNYMLQIWTQQHASMQAPSIALHLSSLPQKIITDIAVMSQGPVDPSAGSPGSTMDDDELYAARMAWMPRRGDRRGGRSNCSHQARINNTLQ